MNSVDSRYQKVDAKPRAQDIRHQSPDPDVKGFNLNKQEQGMLFIDRP
jgi:hypothetical protein